ncbi:28 kDa heat- and acid-stable phosphoprotein [Teleopsis dalmanni]|uniref:28 kDa heat- and acid-stable phosphoprotein n=1 Tax=Teleopsis dalmanni TaxID=139649 RepID=UPI0018CEF846|nr:28 kDa heat- and acid-stable phosphoprotein [Teleopsis dalmanni]
MPRGKYVNHKGRSRHFTSPEDLLENDLSEENTSGDEGVAGPSKPNKHSLKDEDESDQSEDSEDERDKRKGVASLIEIENPNRSVKKGTHKIHNMSEEKNTKPELTRREREQIEKQKARIRYEKLHAAGKTSEAKADLARLALIRQQRMEAAAKREADKKALDAKKAFDSNSKS